MIAIKSTMPGRRPGFSLLEILLVITVAAFLFALVMPLLRRAQPGRERKQFVTQLNALVQLAMQQSIMTRKVHRVVFSMSERRAAIEIEQESEKFVPVKTGQTSTFAWARELEIKQFIVEGFDEMERRIGRRTDKAWFFIIPDGMAQNVIINYIDRSDTIDDKPLQRSLVLNPFTAQFRSYDAFQK